MRTDPFALLERSRPSEERLDQLWPSAQREVTMGRAYARAFDELAPAQPAPPTKGRRGRLPSLGRTALTGALAAACAAALWAGPSIVAPSSTPTAMALERLATVAESRAAAVIPPGKYFEMTTVEQPDGDPGQLGYPVTRVSWADSAGNVWGKDTGAGHPATYAYFPHHQGDSPSMPSPSYARSLPTDPVAMEAYLRARVDGGSSQDEAVFTAVGDMLRVGYIPPRVRATAIQTLARLPEVTVRAAALHDGRRGVRVDFVDAKRRHGWVQSLFFDPRTSFCVQEATTIRGPNGSSFLSLTTRQGVVGSVPASVRRHAVTYRE